MLSSNFNIIIDIVIGEPGHRKDIVYITNSDDKRYLKEQKCIIGTPETNNRTKGMKAHAMVGKTKSSWLITCKKLLDDNTRVHEVNSYNKESKRETE